MEMLQDRFTQEATKKYTGITVSGKKLNFYLLNCLNLDLKWVDR